MICLGVYVNCDLLRRKYLKYASNKSAVCLNVRIFLDCQFYSVFYKTILANYE